MFQKKIEHYVVFTLSDFKYNLVEKTMCEKFIELNNFFFSVFIHYDVLTTK